MPSGTPATSGMPIKERCFSTRSSRRPPPFKSRSFGLSRSASSCRSGRRSSFPWTSASSPPRSARSARRLAPASFESDLQGRLEALVFELPPLRERIEDLGVLVASALRKIGVTEKDNPRLTIQAASRLLRYDWPRNIRELALAIDVAWGGAKNGEITDGDLPKPTVDEGTSRSRLKQQIVAHMRATKGNVADVAQKMGRTRQIIYHYLKRFEIDPESFRSE